MFNRISRSNLTSTLISYHKEQKANNHYISPVHIAASDSSKNFSAKTTTQSQEEISCLHHRLFQMHLHRRHCDRHHCQHIRHDHGYIWRFFRLMLIVISVFAMGFLRDHRCQRSANPAACTSLCTYEQIIQMALSIRIIV